MQNSLKNDVKYLNNLDLVRIWDLFQESACCLKDLYTDTNYGHRNVKNFVKTIKSLDNFYKGTVDVLIKKRERYTDIGFERERLKLLQWYLVKGKNETFDKKKLLRHVYRKRLKTDKNLKYRRIGYLYGDNFPPEHGDSRVTISNYGIYGGESVAGYLPPNRALQLDSRMKRDVGVFNDAVNLKTLQGDLSDFELGDTQPFMYPDMGGQRFRGMPPTGAPPVSARDRRRQRLPRDP